MHLTMDMYARQYTMDRHSARPHNAPQLPRYPLVRTSALSEASKGERDREKEMFGLISDSSGHSVVDMRTMTCEKSDDRLGETLMKYKSCLLISHHQQKQQQQ